MKDRKTEKEQIVHNIVFNFLKTLASLLFPVVTFAYSARILGAEGIGRVNYSKSITTYFCMIAVLGMNYYGTREVSKARDDKDKLNQLFSELLIINCFSTLIAYALFFIIISVNRHLYSYHVLLMINSFSIFLSGLGMEWVYQGLEKYKYIAIRSVSFQIIAIVLMIVFVRDATDINAYACIMVFATMGFNLLNILECRKYVKLVFIKKTNILRHISSILWLFAFAVSIELYTVLDSTMLGYLKGDTTVGIYSVAIKVNKMLITLICSMGAVLIPRLSYYIGKSDKEQIHNIIEKAYNYGFMISIPMFLGLLCLSREIIVLLTGRGFETAIVTMKIITPIVLIIPFSVMTNQQTLIPMGKEKRVLIASLLAAVTNIIMNSILIPRYAEKGAAIATVCAELVAAVVSYINAKQIIELKGELRLCYQYVIAAMPIPVFHYLFINIFNNDTAILLFTGISSAVAYVLILRLFKNQYSIDMIKILMQKVRKNNGEN